MLNERAISYVEMINDAGDVMGTDCVIRAGYLPCAYIPCFKKQGDQRRDYVVLCRSFDRLVGASATKSKVHPVYLEFLSEYFKLDRAHSMGQFI